jgi:potassium-dependent mechanosensitive channel
MPMRPRWAPALVAIVLAAALALAASELRAQEAQPLEADTSVSAPTQDGRIAIPESALPDAGTTLTTTDQVMPVVPDMAVWEFLARRVEAALEDARTPNLVLEQLRTRVAEWRTRFLEAQTANQSRIASLRDQLAALGPAPEAGVQEPAEIAARRRELETQLRALEAPVLAAEEAFRRADGLIREIDATLRERQADALMQLSPTPLNPANWPAGYVALRDAVAALGTELRDAWSNPTRREEFSGNIPAILAYLAFAIVLLLRGRGWIERAEALFQRRASARGREVFGLLMSLGQIVLPFIGVLALIEALRASGLVGLRGQVLVDALPLAGLTILVARWVGVQVFPWREDAVAVLRLSAERRREGRFHAGALGLVLAFEGVRRSFFEGGALSEAAESVLAFPLLLVTALLLFRLGQIVRLHMVSAAAGEDATPGFADRILGFVGRLVILVGVGATVLGAIGYMAAAAALVYPTAYSLGVIGLLLILVRLVGDLFVWLSGGDEAARDQLVPVLVNFSLVVVSLPVFALVWGVRGAELAEIWVRFLEGVTLGETRISPVDFLTFVLVFVVGYTVTRLVQGALRTSVLPKTKLDKGGQVAIVSGLGYAGILLAALIAFSTAGIDLSSLAIVAGALSVGIGFGLQTIVSNFVSGIILLFERPVAEGDWIEVGGVMGTVRKISVRSTIIQTFDRTDVIVPNADLISGQVTNWTRFSLTGRLIVKVGVAYGTDTRRVASILYEIAEAQPLVVLNPPPSVFFRGFGADSLDFEIRMILRDVNFMLKVETDVNHMIAERFVAEGIEIPFAQRDIWLRNPEALHPPAPAVTPGPIPREASAPPAGPVPDQDRGTS